jgi:hypothetical protein
MRHKESEREAFDLESLVDLERHTSFIISVHFFNGYIIWRTISGEELEMRGMVIGSKEENWSIAV